MLFVLTCYLLLYLCYLLLDNWNLAELLAKCVTGRKSRRKVTTLKWNLRTRELNVTRNKVPNSKILKFAGINRRKSKTSQKVTLYDLDLKGVVSETPTSFSFWKFWDIDCGLQAERRPTVIHKLICRWDRRNDYHWDRQR